MLISKSILWFGELGRFPWLRKSIYIYYLWKCMYIYIINILCIYIYYLCINLYRYTLFDENFQKCIYIYVILLYAHVYRHVCICILSIFVNVYRWMDDGTAPKTNQIGETKIKRSMVLWVSGIDRRPKPWIFKTSNLGSLDLLKGKSTGNRKPCFFPQILGCSFKCSRPIQRWGSCELSSSAGWRWTP